MYKLQTVNNFENSKVKTGKCKKILHKKLFNFPYFNSFILGSTGTGKTNLMYNILKSLSYCDDTKIIIVSSTMDNDKVMKKIIEDFSKYNEIIPFPQLSDETIDEILEIISTNEEHEKYCYAKTIIIMDDIKGFLRSSKLYDLMSKVRHFFSHIFVLSQYFKDISPDIRSQVRFLIIFKGWNKQQLKSIYNDFIKDGTFEEFLNKYEFATKDDEDSKNNALYCSLVENEFRKNLNKKIISV